MAELFQMLFLLAGRGTEAARQQAGRDCLSFVQTLGRRPVTNRRGLRLVVPDRIRQDVVQDVVCKINEDPVRIVRAILKDESLREAGLSDDAVALGTPGDAHAVANAKVARYIEVVVTHRAVDVLRKQNRLTSLEDISLSAPVQRFTNGLVHHTLELLHLAARRHLRSIEDGALRQQQRETWDEIVALALGDVAMAQLVAREIERDSTLRRLGVRNPKKARDRARGRLAQRHSRVRRYVHRAIDELESLAVDEGGLRPDQAHLAHEGMKVLLVRRRTE